MIAIFLILSAEICNKTAKGIIDELGQTLNRLSADKKKKVVMVYFMGCTQMVCTLNNIATLIQIFYFFQDCGQHKPS